MSDLKARVMADIARTPSPTRAEARARARVVLGAAALLTLGSFFALGGVVIGDRASSLVAFAVVCTGGLAAVSTWIAFGARSMLGRPPRALAAGAALAVVGLFAVVAAASALWPSAEIVPRSTDVGCAVLTVLQGALPLAAFMWWRRGLDAVRPLVTGAAFGVAAGAWSAALAYLRCPHAAAEHGAIAHAAPSLLLMAIGAALGAAVLRLR